MVTRILNAAAEKSMHTSESVVDLVLCRLAPIVIEECSHVSTAWREASRRAIRTRCLDLSLGSEAVRVSVDCSGAAGQYFPEAAYIAECVGGSADTCNRLRNAKAEGCGCSDCTSGCRCCTLAPLAYDEVGRLRALLHEPPRSTVHHTPVIECADCCRCPQTCSNRVVSRGLCVTLTIFMTRDGRGWGVRAAQSLQRGQFVCEYAGEILSSAESKARRRAAAQARDGSSSSSGGNYYIMSVVEHVGKLRRALTTTIDPTSRGNVGRYLNHSCAPNLEVQLVRCGSLVPRVAFFCSRDVAAGEELTFHYGSAQPESQCAATEDEQEGGGRCGADATAGRPVRRRPCRCGAPGCAKWLPFDASADG